MTVFSLRLVISAFGLTIMRNEMAYERMLNSEHEPTEDEILKEVGRKTPLSLAESSRVSLVALRSCVGAGVTSCIVISC